MQEKRVYIETVGTISKKENVIFFKNSTNILALETAHAYPGYNGVVPQDYNPNSLFLITKERYYTETIFRVSQNIRKEVNCSFKSAFATIEYQNREYPAIRLKDIKDYNHIPQLLLAYVEKGILFEKKKNLKEFNTLIKVTKGFYIEPMGKSCYRDLFDSRMFYFEIPDCVKWKDFERMILDIKYNTPGLDFDAALAYFYRATKIVDTVRIFKENISLEELSFIRDKFLNLL